MADSEFYNHILAQMNRVELLRENVFHRNTVDSFLVIIFSLFILLIVFLDWLCNRQLLLGDLSFLLRQALLLIRLNLYLWLIIRLDLWIWQRLRKLSCWLLLGLWKWYGNRLRRNYNSLLHLSYRISLLRNLQRSLWNLNRLGYLQLFLRHWNSLLLSLNNLLRRWLNLLRILHGSLRLWYCLFGYLDSCLRVWKQNLLQRLLWANLNRLRYLLSRLIH